MTQEIPFTIAFLAGVFSFLSPCVLPIVPGFISYIVGKSFSDLQNSSKKENLKLLPLIILFIIGFSIVFIIMGASIDFLSDFFYDLKNIPKIDQDHNQIVIQICSDYTLIQKFPISPTC